MGTMRCDIMKLVVIIVAFAIQSAQSQTYDNMTKLRSDLLQNYHRDVLPLNNQADVMNVNVTLQLYYIIDVDSVKGVVTIVCSTLCRWIDERLQWNPSNYGGIQRVLYYQDEVWKPPITLGTPIEFTTMWNPDLHVTVSANGHAFMNTGDVIESQCTFNMKFWPLDKQVCDIVFLAFDYDPSQITLHTPGLNLLKNQSAEWTVEKTDFFAREYLNFSQVVYRIYLRRQSTFYILSIILPIVGMTMVSSLVFLLPNEAGERVSYSITIMLSLAVFLTVVTDQMPKTSEPIAFVCVFLFTAVIVSLVSMVIVILNMRLYYKPDNTPVGRWYRLFVRVVNLKPCKAAKVKPDEVIIKCLKSETEGSEVTANKNIRFGTRNEQSGLIFVVPQDTVNSTTDEGNAGNKDKSDDKISWQDVSKAIDIIAFTTSTLFTTIGSTVFFIYLSTASDYVEPA